LDDPQNTRIGNVDAPKDKRDVLLCPQKGLTDLNLGTTFIVDGIVTVWSFPQVQMQVTQQPVAHRFAGLTKRCYAELERCFISGIKIGDTIVSPPTLTGKLSKWTEFLESPETNKPALAAELRKDAKLMASKLKTNMIARLKPYWPTLLALELLDLSIPNSTIFPIELSTWDALKSLVGCCSSAFEDGINFLQLQKELLLWRQKADKLNQTQIDDINKNLLRYFHNTRNADKTNAAQDAANVVAAKSAPAKAKAELQRASRVITLPPEIEKYGVVVFTYPIWSLVESVFSDMTYNKGGHRARLTDSNCLNVIQCKGFEPVDKDTSAPLLQPVYNAKAALQHDLNYSLHD
jgi:hypothetical protein